MIGVISMNNRCHFEGWYFKCSTQGHTLAIIVGRAKEKFEEAFIQVIKSGDSKSYYIPYDTKTFSYQEEPFSLRVGSSIFTEDYMYLNIQGSISIKGIIYFDSFIKLSQKVWKKGLMGPFGYLPLMECYHDVVSMRHALWGKLLINDYIVNFENGEGYIERDWGTSFPNSYLWMQCNHFNQSSLSIMLAIADIPFLACNFRGFLCVISIENETRIFATYTGAKIEKIINEEDGISVCIRQGKEVIQVKTSYDKGHMLKAPNKGAMRGTVYEVLDGKMQLQMYYNERLKVNLKGERVAFERVGRVEDINHKIRL